MFQFFFLFLTQQFALQMSERVGKSERASAALAAEVAALGQRLGRIQPRVAVARLAVVSAEIQRDARALQHRLHTLLPRLQQVGANSGSGGASGIPGSSTAPPASGGKGRALNHCRIDEPWLSQIVSGAKTFEGRVNRGMWATLARGDILLASSERYKEVELEVTVLHTFADFDGAFEALGTALLPNGAANAVDALALYRQWFVLYLLYFFWFCFHLVCPTVSITELSGHASNSHVQIIAVGPV